MIPQPIEVTIRAFVAADQNAVRRLILDGLGARWGQVDERLNPDLNDIAATYGDGLTLTAWAGDYLVGTGTLAPGFLDVGESYFAVEGEPEQQVIGAEYARTPRLFRVVPDEK